MTAPKLILTDEADDYIPNEYDVETVLWEEWTFAERRTFNDLYHFCTVVEDVEAILAFRICLEAVNVVAEAVDENQLRQG